MFLTSNEQASGYPVKSLTSKLAGASRTTKAQLVLQNLVSFMILAGVKCSKGTRLMNFSQLELLFVPPGSSARIIPGRLGRDAG